MTQLQKAVAERVKVVDADDRLSPAAREAAQASLTEAQSRLQSTADDQSATAQLVTERLAAPAILATLSAGVNSSSEALPEGWSSGTQAQLRIILAEIDAAARATVQRATQLHEQLSDLRNQAPLIGQQLADARQALAAVRAELAQLKYSTTTGEADDIPLLALSREQALLARIGLLEEKRDSSDLRSQLYAAEIAAADSEVTLRAAELAVVKDVLARRSLSDAVAGSSDWQQTSVGRYPAIAALAKENRELADLYVGPSAIIQRSDQARGELAATERAIADFTSDTTEMRNRLVVLGRSQAAGALVRETLKYLPRLDAYKREIASRAQTIDQTQVRIVELNQERRRLQENASAAIDLVVAGMPGLPADQHEEARKVAASLLKSREQILQPLVRDLQQYSDVQSELQARQRTYVSDVQEVAAQLRARESWVRNSHAVTRADLPYALASINALFAPGLWSNRGEAPHDAARVKTGMMLTGLMMFAAVVALLWRMSNWATRFGAANSTPSRRRILLRALLGGFAWMMLVLSLGWWLSRIQTAPPGVIVLATSLRGISPGVFAVAVLASLLARHGGISELRPDLRDLMARTRLAVPIMLAIMVITILSQILYMAHAEALASQANLAARLCQIVSVLMLAYVMHRLLAPRVRAALARGRKLWVAAWLCAYAVVMMLPVGIIGMLAQGFMVGAWELTRSLFVTLLFVGIAVALRAATSTPGDTDDSVDHRGDAALRYGRAQLANVVTIVVVAIMMLWVWRDVFAALGYLSNIALWTTATDTGARTVTVANLLSSVTVLVGTLISFWALPLIAGTQSLDTTARGVGTRYAVVTLVRYLLLLSGILSSFALLNIGWSKIQWLATGLSVGLGFGLQEIVANFFSGLILLSERSIRVGDLVSIGDSTGIVQRIHVRATTVRDFDGRELLIPNKDMVSTQVTNWTLSNTNRRLQIVVGVSYGSDTGRVVALLLDAASQVPGVLADPPPTVSFEAFADSALQFRLYAWIDVPTQAVTIGHWLHMRIEAVLRENGISIPFPQRDLHLVDPVPLPVRDSPSPASPSPAST